VPLANLVEELVDRDVLLRAKELFDDRFTLRGRVEPAILDIGSPALLELACIVGPKVRPLAHVGVQLPRK
jgi:hypothetical protein